MARITDPPVPSATLVQTSPTSTQTIQPTADVTPIKIMGRAAGQTAPLLELDDHLGVARITVGKEGASSGGYLKFYGANRGADTYLTQIGSDFAYPNIATNTAITINGATGDPVPSTIAGETAYMLGIGSDVGAAPAVVIKGSAGPILRLYNAIDVKVAEWISAGPLSLVSGLGAAPNLLPAFSFLTDTASGLDLAAAGTPIIVAGGNEQIRFNNASGVTIKDGQPLTAGGAVTLKNYVSMTGAQGNAFIDWASTALLGNPSAETARVAVRTVGGKVQLYVIFPTGAAVPIATEA